MSSGEAPTHYIHICIYLCHVMLFDLIDLIMYIALRVMAIKPRHVCHVIEILIDLID